MLCNWRLIDSSKNMVVVVRSCDTGSGQRVRAAGKVTVRSRRRNGVCGHSLTPLPTGGLMEVWAVRDKRWTSCCVDSSINPRIRLTLAVSLHS